MNMKRFMNKKVAAIGLAAGLVLGGAGAAFAYFTSTGTGNGTATAGSATQWNVSVSGNNTSLDLVPGPLATAVADTESYTITNASTGSQNLAKAVISISSVTPGAVAGPNLCTAADFSIGGNAVGTPFTQTIGVDEPGTSPGPAGVYSNTVSLQLVDNGANQDQCQGAVVHLTVNAS
jgi:hypothetical protein